MVNNWPNGDASRVESPSLVEPWVTARAATLPFLDLLNESRYMRISQKFDSSCRLLKGNFGIAPIVPSGGLTGVKQIGNVLANEINMSNACPVSYTHLDVYKRQA